MKTILVPTDFSEAADNAARYAIHLAKTLKANVKLCNAIKVPLESSMAANLVWPAYNYDDLEKDVLKELKHLADRLMTEDRDNTSLQSFHPRVDTCCGAGPVTDVVKNIVGKERICLVVMGMSGAGKVSRFLLGSNSRDLIDVADFPVLLIPHTATFKPIEKVTFATNLSGDDIGLIHSLAGLVRPFNAELLISNLSDTGKHKQDHQKMVDGFLNDVTCKVDYPKIYYRQISTKEIDEGLEWISLHTQANMLAIVHHKPVMFSLFDKSYTQKLAKHITIPLLVFPKVKAETPLPVF